MYSGVYAGLVTCVHKRERIMSSWHKWRAYEYLFKTRLARLIRRSTSVIWHDSSPHCHWARFPLCDRLEKWKWKYIQRKYSRSWGVAPPTLAWTWASSSAWERKLGGLWGRPFFSCSKYSFRRPVKLWGFLIFNAFNASVTNCWQLWLNEWK